MHPAEASFYRAHKDYKREASDKKLKSKCMQVKKCMHIKALNVDRKSRLDSLECYDQATVSQLDCEGVAKIEYLNCQEDLKVKSLECYEIAEVERLDCYGKAKINELECEGSAHLQNIDCAHEVKTQELAVLKQLKTEEFKCLNQAVVGCLKCCRELKAQSLVAEWNIQTENLLITGASNVGSLNVGKNVIINSEVYNSEAWGQVRETATALNLPLLNIWTPTLFASIVGDPNMQSFTTDGITRLIHTSSTSRYFRIKCTLTATLQIGGLPISLDFSIFKNSTGPISGTIVSLIVNPGFSNSTSINKIIRLDAYDYIELYDRVTANPQPFTVSYNMSCVELLNLVV
jgi:hypothetical protein